MRTELLECSSDAAVATQHTNRCQTSSDTSLMMSGNSKDESILIDEEMLQEALAELCFEDEVQSNIWKEKLQFSEADTLSLVCKGIVKIGCLWEFTSLTKLELNNNCIKKIEGLNSLVNLTWLNLSFNGIEKIEGLDSLRKLEVLNLFTNRISVIENMDTLENLTLFSIADNLVEQLEQVIYLRKFKKLHTLNLYGNPICKEDNYKLLIAAYFPDLSYLDYRLLDNKTKQEASVRYLFETEQQADKAKKSEEAELQLHKDAFVEFLNGPSLFQTVIKDDPQVETLRCLPEVADLLHTFEQQMVTLCMQLFEAGLFEHKQRETEVKSFFRGQTQAVSDNQQRAVELVDSYDLQHEESMKELHQLSDSDEFEVKVKACSRGIDTLFDSLMALEMQLVVQLEDIIQIFDQNISDMTANFTETAKVLFAQCRDLENEYDEKVRGIAVETLKKVEDGTLDDDMPEDIAMMFEDKESVMEALTTCHNNRLSKINDRENQLIARISAWRVDLVKGIQDKEMHRNRARILEMFTYVDYLRDQLLDFQ
ncbi:dynein regulatory complex subunit 3 isoform X1 [Thalassophryne amazonica]|uniref:dynein regulatory complex subunit 3 isoform X1 n=1 Tax=Thalassophryne amazonica TaxID=390379 RepID=UPI0014725314|nr:dynein regulatory complex subunit 3 isoform X1 [Thalassophryne amazonica]